MKKNGILLSGVLHHQYGYVLLEFTTLNNALGGISKGQ